MGLAFGTIPFLLKERGSTYADLAQFSFVSLPYALKLLIAPLVDSFYSRAFGRRKSWIVPIQLCIGAITFSCAPAIHRWVQRVAVANLTAIFLTVITLTAVQDIAVDGWSLTILRACNVQYASTCQSLGQSIGFFSTFTVFLALSSVDFCNSYVRAWLWLAPSNAALLDLRIALRLIGVFYLCLTGYIAFFKAEMRDDHRYAGSATSKKRDGDDMHSDDARSDDVRSGSTDTGAAGSSIDHCNGARDGRVSAEVSKNVVQRNDCAVDDESFDLVQAETSSVLSISPMSWEDAVRSIRATYADLLVAVRLPAVKSLIFCMLLAKVGFSAYDNGSFSRLFTSPRTPFISALTFRCRLFYLHL